MNNLFTNIPPKLQHELTEVLTESNSVRIERIVSTGHNSPEGFWYEQDEHEWIAVLKGAAQLFFDGEDQPIPMRPGDFINVPSGRKHRVKWTTPDEPTIWLAVFYRD